MEKKSLTHKEIPELKLDKKIIIGAIAIFLFLCVLIGTVIYLISNLKDNSIKLASTATITPTASIHVTPTTATGNLEKIIRFKNYTFDLTGMETSANNQYFWGNANPIVSNQTTSDNVISSVTPNINLVYLTKLDKFYDIGPGSLVSWSIVDDNKINDLAKNRTQVLDPTTGLTMKTNCVKSFERVGQDILNTVDCVELFNDLTAPTSFYPDNIQRSCYYNFTPGKNLLVIYEVTGIDSDGDACQYLKDLGFSYIILAK